MIHRPICLLPQVKQKIAQHYPGTRLAFTEYNYGGNNHISGAIAEADVLGIFGREGVFAASIWGGGNFAYAAFDSYCNYDGQGGRFGDLALQATSSSIEDVSVYASTFENDPGQLLLVLINRAEQGRTCTLNVAGFTFSRIDLYRLAATEARVKPAGTIAAKPGDSLALPAMTVTTAVLSQ